MEILDTGFDMDAYEMKKHVFTVTTMTPKLCDALQVVEAMFEDDRRHWWTSYLAAEFALAVYEEKRGFTDQVIPMYQVCRDAYNGLPMFTTDELILFFRMYAEKIDGWLNGVFSEESEASNWSDQNTEYHDIFKVLSGLKNLADRLEHLN